MKELTSILPLHMFEEKMKEAEFGKKKRKPLEGRDKGRSVAKVSDLTRTLENMSMLQTVSRGRDLLSFSTKQLHTDGDFLRMSHETDTEKYRKTTDLDSSFVLDKGRIVVYNDGTMGNPHDRHCPPRWEIHTAAIARLTDLLHSMKEVSKGSVGDAHSPADCAIAAACKGGESDAMYGMSESATLTCNAS